MNTKAILDDAIKAIRATPVRLYGDDSPLSDPWEEIKDQVQHELSFAWPAYLMTMTGFIEGTVSCLSTDDLMLVSAEMNIPPDDYKRLVQAILKRLLAKAKKEKINYSPFEFEYFRYALSGCGVNGGDMAVYAHVVARTGIYTCEIIGYSGAVPKGESGEINTNTIENIMSADEFEEARQQHWPDEWKNSRTRT
jgi:hypothetical protein